MLSSLFVLPIHRHALAGENVGKGTFVTELAVPLDEPSTSFLLGPRLGGGMGEWTRRSGSTPSNFVEFTGDM